MYDKEVIDLADKFEDTEIVSNEEKDFEPDEYEFHISYEVSGDKACKLVNYLDYQIDNIDKEIKRLAELKKSYNNKVNNVKNYILFLIKEKGIKNFGLNKVSLRHSKEVKINENVNIEDIPEQFLNIETKKTISKTKIKDYLNDGFIDNETGECFQNTLNFAYIAEKENVIIK